MVFFTNAKSCGISGQILGCISSFLRNRRFLDGKSSQKYSVMQELLKAPFLVLHFSYYTLMTFLMMLSVILLSMLMILLSILGVIGLLICGNNLNWLLNYETQWTGVRSGLLISMLGKLNWFCLTGLITLVLLMRKWNNGKINHFLRCWGWLSLLNWIEAFTLSAGKSDSKKIGASIHSMKFFSSEVALYLYKSTITHEWNTVVTSELMPLVATWNCYTSYKIKYAGLLAHRLLIVKMWPA